MSDLPEPPIAAEVDLRGLPWMPVDTVRLLDSDLWALSTGEQFKVAFRLWMKAWQQVPAASLPSDDRILVELSGTGRMGQWQRVKGMALRGFVLCSDGRLYHPVLVEKALEAWKHRVAQRERANKRWKDHGDATASATAMQGTGTGKGTATGKGQTTTKTSKTSAATRRPANGESKAGPTWEAFQAAYRARYEGVEHRRNAAVNAQMLAFVEKVGVQDAPLIAEFYVSHGGAWYRKHSHAVKFLMQNAESLATEWATGRRVTDAEARSADQTAARVEQVHRLTREKAA